jgi:hypothetical protein
MDDISMAIEDDMYFNEQHNQLNRKSFYANQIVNHIERFQDGQDYDKSRCKIFIEANNE